MLILLGMQRLSYTVPAVVSHGSPAYRSATVNVALLGRLVGGRGLGQREAAAEQGGGARRACPDGGGP